jgi:hypothetical protein
VYQVNGAVMAGTGTSTPRSALVWCREESFQERFLIDTVGYRGRVTAQNGQTFNLFGLNAARGDQDLKWYQPSMGARTLTSAAGFEAILDRDHRVVRVEDGIGSAEIPADGSVLSGAGAGATWLRQNAIPGSQFRIEAELTTTRPASETGCTPVDIVGGGPRLVRDGRRDIPDERFGHEATRNPRTVVASTRDGKLWFLTLDGRQASSAGMRLDELADELMAMGAVEAINLDGGGSTAMVVGDLVRNSPSDGTERTVSDSLLVYSIADAAALEALGERLSADAGQMNEEFARCFRNLMPDRLYADMLTLLDALPRGRSAATERLLREAASELRATRSAALPPDPGEQLCSPATGRRTDPPQR